jgi:ribosome-binding protein aMBF1 (putative translation factor)
MSSEQDWNNVVFRKESKNQNKSGIKTDISCSNTVKKIYDQEKPNMESDIKPIIINKEFGLKIQKARLLLKMNQEQFAQAVSIPKSIITDYEKGNGIRNGTFISKINNFIDKNT